jgi:hypothetical protein
MRSKLLACVVILVSVCPGCIKRNIGTKSILENPCSPPCWQDITPGITTESQAIEILNQNKITKKEPFQESLLPYLIFDKSICQKFLDQGGVCFDENKEIIQGIGIVPIENLSIEQLISLYGDPSHVLFFKGWGDFSFVVKIVVYESMGIYVDLKIAPYDHNDKPAIEPSDKIDMISFYNPTIFRDYLNKLYNTNLDQGDQEIDVFSQPWHGFGEYEYSR